MIEDDRVRYVHAPECLCFDEELNPNAALKHAAASTVAMHMAAALREMMDTADLCVGRSLPYVLSLVIINVVTLLATTPEDGPGIEQGTQEALEASERVLMGTERRTLEIMRGMYSEARRLGVNAETVSKW